MRNTLRIRRSFVPRRGAYRSHSRNQPQPTLTLTRDDIRALGNIIGGGLVRSVLLAGIPLVLFAVLLAVLSLIDRGIL